jgi:nucleotide-binding universal stress UspA family protein
MSRMFNTILVSVDFSSYSTEALLYAASIAEPFSSSLLVLHVIAKEIQTYAIHRHLEHSGLPHHAFPLFGPFSEMREEPTEMTDAVVVDLREQAHTALQQFLPPQLVGRPLSLHIELGHPFEQILETARREHVDLIVMGTHGRTGLEHLMLGSVAERVVRLAPCPVLTVKTAAPPSS